MTPRADLHVHTTFSDGVHSPAEVVQMSLAAGLDIIAISDHDTVEGIPQAVEAAEGTGLEIIPAVELSTQHAQGAELHLLGYMVDYCHAELIEALARFRQARRDRARRIVTRLEALGIPVAWEEVSALADDGVVGRAHIARALHDAGYVASVREAFDEYLGRGCPAYVPRTKMTPAEAIDLIHRAGGVSVLAHPWGMTPLIPDLVQQGLQGLEIYYPSYTSDGRAYLQGIADEHELLCTGGSDFHGLEIMPENVLGQVDVPPSCVEMLRARARRQADEHSVARS